MAKRRQIMGWYRDRLAGERGVRLNREAPWARNAFWLVCLEVDELTDQGRETLMRELKTAGVDSRPYFYPVSDLPMYDSADTPVAHRVAPTGINLPTYFTLTEQDVDEICREVLAALGKLSQK